MHVFYILLGSVDLTHLSFLWFMVYVYVGPSALFSLSLSIQSSAACFIDNGLCGQSSRNRGLWAKGWDKKNYYYIYINGTWKSPPSHICDRG